MKFLIILASYNGEKYIAEQLISILNQKDVSVDILIFDDCSSDKTIDIINNFNDERILLKRNKISSGSAAMNFLNGIIQTSSIVFSKYDFFAFSDQDDIWHSDKLISSLNRMKIDSSELYCANLILWDEISNNSFTLRKDFQQTQYDFLFEGGSAGCTYVLSRNLFLNLKNTIIDIKLAYWDNLSHDWLLYFLTRIKGYKVSIDPVPKITYRIHQNNVHGHLNTNTLISFFNKFKIVFNGWYFEHIKHFIKLTPPNSDFRYIYHFYTKNWFTRFFILIKYNFKLFRSKRKFIQFAILSLIPRFKL